MLLITSVQHNNCTTANTRLFTSFILQMCNVTLHTDSVDYSEAIISYYILPYFFHEYDYFNT